MRRPAGCACRSPTARSWLRLDLRRTIWSRACYVGVPHGVELEGDDLFFRLVHLHGGPAPVRRYLPTLIELVWSRKIDPGKVFDLTLPLERVADGYRAIKALLRP